MLNEIMRYIRNYFPVPGGYHGGRFTISEGTIDLPFMLYGQYFCIEGSRLNDGVYQYPAFGLNDEAFDGYVTELAPPAEFLSLVGEIEEWHEKFGDVSSSNMSPFNSESFGGYTYNKGSSGGSNSSSWKDTFGKRLNTWRKI